MPFAPGQSGNPAGAKPTEKSFSAQLRRAIAQDDGKRIRAAAEKLLDLAADGEAWAIQQLADRLDGKPSQAVKVSGDEDGPPVSLRATVELIHARALSDTGKS